MTVRLLAILLLGAVLALFPDVGLAQDWPEFPPVDPEDPHAFVRGPGAYLAWWKILLVTITFLGWVRLADWMNIDCMRFAGRTRILPAMWNPIVVGTFLLSFVALLVIPIFWVGFAVNLIATVTPFVTYIALRNSRMPAHQAVFTRTHLSRAMKGDSRLIDPVMESGEGPPIDFEAGGTPAQSQVNLIRARQSSNLNVLRALFYDAIASRADTVLAVRGSQGVQWRKRIDGVWHALPAMDREIGDAAVASLKHLANMDPQEGAQVPTGNFLVRTEERPMRCESSIAWQNQSEQLWLRLIESKKPPMTLEELGMFPDSVERFKEAIRSPGIIIVSANPGNGLSTSWQSVLQATDRVTRDWVAILDHNETETRVENIEINRFDSRKGQTPLDVIRSILLKQPEALVLPKISDAATMDMMAHQVTKERRIVVTSTPARSAAEALLRMLNVAGRKSDFIAAVTAATGQRLARRLCDQCKQPMAVSPELIKQLGGDPDNAPTIYKQYTKPDPLPVDKKGRPIEIEPCKKCAGIGYYGRVGLIELVIVDDAIRQALAKQPDLPTLTNLALQKRHQSALQQGYRHILAGTTSPAEVQRVFKETN